MVCWMKYINTVQKYLKDYNVNKEQAEEILRDVEKQVGHNANLIKAIVDFEKGNLIKRLKKKKKEKQKEEAYGYT
jgi:hypothetical protein